MPSASPSYACEMCKTRYQLRISNGAKAEPCGSCSLPTERGKDGALSLNHGDLSRWKLERFK